MKWTHKYKNSHYKDKGAWWPSFLHLMTIHISDKTVFILRRGFNSFMQICRPMSIYFDYKQLKHRPYQYFGYCLTLNPFICYQMFVWNYRLLDVMYFAHLIQSPSANSVQPLWILLLAGQGQVQLTAHLWSLRDPNTLEIFYYVVLPMQYIPNSSVKDSATLCWYFIHIV